MSALKRLAWAASLFACLALVWFGLPPAGAQTNMIGGRMFGDVKVAASARSFVTASTPKQYLTTTWSHAPTDATRATLNYWTKWIVSPPGLMYEFTTGVSAGVLFNHNYNANTQKHVVIDDLGTYNIPELGTAPDTGVWHNVCILFDTNQAVAADRVKVTVDGTLGIDPPTTAPLLGSNMQLTANTVASYIGEVSYQVGSSSGIPDAKFAYFYFVEGQNPTPDCTAFATGSAGVGNWHPLPYGGAYGNNSVFLNGTGTSGGVTDQSGRGNDFTAPNNITYDADLPT